MKEYHNEILVKPAKRLAEELVETDKKDWLPTQGGTIQGYEPQYYEGDKWKRIPISEQPCGIPYPALFGGILQQIGLMSYAQSEAVRWQWTACEEAKNKKIETQTQMYDIEFEIKARKI